MPIFPNKLIVNLWKQLRTFILFNNSGTSGELGIIGVITFKFKSNYIKTMSLRREVCIVILAITSFLIASNFAEAHLVGSGVATKKIENYEVRFLPFPVYPDPEEPVFLQFSVLDEIGNNALNVEASVKVQKDGEIIYASPQKWYEFGDFYIQYTFPDKGNYQIMLEFNTIDKPKTLAADFAMRVGDDTSGNLPFIAILLGGGTGVAGMLALFVRRAIRSHRTRRKAWCLQILYNIVQ
jgi:hypothetical protein